MSSQRSATDDRPSSPSAEPVVGDPLVSVVLTAYGPSPYLQEAFDSALRQSLDPTRYEVVLVTDRTRPGLQDPAGMTSARPVVRTVLCSSARKGEFFAAGIRACRGSILSFLNDDDRWLPDKLEAVARWMTGNPPADFHRHESRYFDVDPTVPIRALSVAHLRGRSSGAARILRQSSGRWSPALVGSAWGFNDSSISLRRSIALAALPYLERIDASEDTFLLFAALCLGGTLVAERQVRAAYRVHSRNSSLAGSGAWTPETRARAEREFEMREEMFRVAGVMIGELSPTRRDVLAMARRGLNAAGLASCLSREEVRPRELLGRLCTLLPDWRAVDPLLNLGLAGLGGLGVAAPRLTQRLLLLYGKRLN